METTEDFDLEKVSAILPDGGIVDAEFKLWDENPEDRDRVKLSLLLGGREISSSSDDFFSAMQSIRRELDREGILLNCYGASRNVYPSPMSQDMGQGWRAYKLQIRHPARQENLVSIFDTGPDVIPSSVAEQAQFYEQWLKSLG